MAEGKGRGIGEEEISLQFLEVLCGKLGEYSAIGVKIIMNMRAPRRVLTYP